LNPKPETLNAAVKPICLSLKAGIKAVLLNEYRKLESWFIGESWLIGASFDVQLFQSVAAKKGMNEETIAGDP
jgi:hypothetical protein